MVIDSISESEIDLVIERLREQLSVKSNRALSEKLGLSHSGVAMARKKGTLPYGPIVNACVNYKISLDEVFGIDVDQTSDSSSTEEKPTKSENA
ncbi:helix-turn-helix domain-containing protein, partial [Pseudoalteromonas luteoviolacea]|uniref:helix-turn-helix domain-containing protein n=1 Tax=Pseudoalteromonas luteoviolacea TaxID=43657 RepID=UPI001B385925